LTSRPTSGWCGRVPAARAAQPFTLGRGGIVNKLKVISLVFFVGMSSGTFTQAEEPINSTYQRSTRIRNSIEFRFVVSNPGQNSMKVETDDGSDLAYVQLKPVLTSADIQEAILTVGNSKALTVRLKMNEAGAAKLKKLTEKNKGKRLAVLGDGKLLIAPVIMSALTGGFMEFFEVNNDDKTRWIYKQIVEE